MRDEELFGRSVETLIESWVYLASGSLGAELVRAEDAAIAAFAQADSSALEVIEPGPAEFWAIDRPGGLLPELDPSGAHFYVAHLDGQEYIPATSTVG